MALEDELNINDITIGNLKNPESFQPSEENNGEGNELTVEQIAATKVLTDFQGANYSEDNTSILDAAGNVVAKKDETGAWVKNETPGDIEDTDEVVEYNLDEGENLLDKDGKILYKKGEYKLIQNEDGSTSLEVPEQKDVDILRSSLKADYAIELLDEAGQPKEYPNTHAGMAEMIKDAGTVISKQNEEATFTNYPQAKHFLNHLIAGRDPKDFFNIPTTFREISIPAETEENKPKLKTLYRDLIMSEFRNRYDYNNMQKSEKSVIDAQAEAWYNYQVHAGTERDTAIANQKLLAGIEAKQEAQRDATNAAIIAKQEQETAKYWAAVKSAVVEKGEIGNLKLPKEKRQGYYDYISKPVNAQGHTQEFIDASQDTEENITLNIQLGLMRYLKLDLDEIVKMKAATKAVETLKLGNSKKTIKVTGKLPIDRLSKSEGMPSLSKIIK